MKSFFRMSYPYLLWIALFIVAPMIMILLYAVTRSGNGTITFSFTLENFSRFLSDPTFLRVLWTSLRIALLTTVFCMSCWVTTFILTVLETPVLVSTISS